MYQDLFLRVFKCMKSKIDLQVRWKHLNEEEFLAIIMNMNFKQCNNKQYLICYWSVIDHLKTDFNRYFATFDLQERSWQ